MGMGPFPTEAEVDILAPVELPVGILTALLGAPFFLYLLRTRQKALGGGL